MITKELYIIRHGETDYNKRGIVQGSGINSSLNEKGVQQAKTFYENYKHIKFDKIYTSELIRTHQSVQNFLNDGVPHQILSGLNEISWGIKEGKEISNNSSTYHEVVQLWSNGKLDVAIEGGETPVQVQERQKPALKTIMSHENESVIMICMHGRALRIFLSLLLNTDLSLMDQYTHSNLCLYKLNYNNQKFEIIEKKYSIT